MGMMKDHKVSVWENEHSIEINASPEVIWALFKDVAGWKRWNVGIEEIELHGSFAAGTEFTMKPPGQDALTTQLVEVSENFGFLDKTCVGELSVFVDHRIEPIGEGRCRVTYSIEAFGPSCDEIGPMISADFPDVLKALAEIAECEAWRAA
jgi:hypothetical protein